MIYTKEEVEVKALKWFHGNDLATNVWIDKYCLRNLKGEFMEDSPTMMHKRHAKDFSRIEQKYPNPISEDEIYTLLEEQVILLGGSLLYGIGNEYAITSLGNCFVVGNDADSIGGIFTTAQEQAQLMKRRAGVGHDISHIRRKGATVTNSAKTSTGVTTWEDLYSFVTRNIAQDGRRGALMMSCDITHDDSEAFIESKDDITKITGANISVKVDDDFMKIAECKDGGDIIFPEHTLWNKLVHQAWKSAEPGVLFWDKIISESPADCYEGFKSTSTNPCGEIPLCPYDSCRLLSINLYSFVDKPFTSGATFDWERFKHVVYIAQKLMDDVVDLEEEKINKILEKIDSDPEDDKIKAIEKDLWLKIRGKLLQGRRTGLSGIGLADALAALNLQYSSDSGINLAEEIYKTLAIMAYRSSMDMSNDRGAFPVWNANKEEKNPFLRRVFKAINKSNMGTIYSTRRRNIALLTIPPSGSIALEAEISSSAEPVYMLSHKRKRKVNPDHPNISFTDKNGDCWEEYVVLHPKFKEWLKTNHKSIDWSKSSKYVQSLNKDDKFIDKLFDCLSEEGLELSIKASPYSGSTAYELNPLDRVKMQGAIQKWVDHSISSTINLPSTATEEDISEIYMAAWKEGCKGITVYRDGCRDGVLTSTDESQVSTTFATNNAPKRPKYVSCDIFTPTSHGQQYVVAVGILDNSPYEVFAFKYDGKFNLDKGYLKKVNRGRYDIVTLTKEVYSEDITSEMSQVEEDRTRIISWGLRHGGGIKFLVEQLGKAKGNGFQTFSRVIARVLKRYIKDKEVITGATCDSCGGTDLIYVGGCSECKTCGSSKC